MRWNSSVLIGVLNYLNNNFELWYMNHLSACVKAIEAINIKRDAKSVYNKIHTLIKAMGKYLRTGEKSKYCSIIWDNVKIHDLVKGIYNKTKERKKNEENKESTSEDDIEMASETSSVRADINSQQMPFSTEGVNNLYNEKILQISELQATLIKKIEDVNSAFKRSNVQIPYSIENANNICDAKVKELFQLKSELTETIETANRQYEELRNFQ